MRRHRGAARLLWPCLLFGFAAGCDDELPTFAGGDRFPQDVIPPTLEHVLDASEFLIAANAYRGPTSISDTRFLMVAQNFEGSLNAHVLAKFNSFPDTISVGGTVNENFQYGSGEVRGIIPDSTAMSADFMTFDLYAVAEPWDSLAVSWENRVDRPGAEVPWSVPGGPKTTLLSTTAWARSDTTAAGDSLRFIVPAAQMELLARGGVHGLLVAAKGENTRGLISRLTVRANIVPESQPDTVVTREFQSAFQTFIHSPDEPQPQEALRVGGITSDRSLLRIGVGNPLPACAEPPGPGCEAVPPDQVSLNRVELILDPVPVPGGFRPVGNLRMVAWRVAEPALGEHAPLANLIDFAEVPGDFFLASSEDQVVVNVTGAITAALATQRDEVGIALLTDPEASSFGYAWYDRNPRLRFLYTLPPNVALP